MHSVELIDANGNTTKHTLPSAWAECSVAQLGAIAALTSVGLPPDATDETKERAEALLRLHLFRALCGLTDAQYDRIEVSDLLAIETDDIGAERVALLPWVNWALKEPMFQQSLVPHVLLKKKKWNGPRDGLERWTIKQWGFADALLMKLASNGTPENLHNLLAALYVPAGETWSNDRIEAHAAQLAALDDRTKLAAVLNYRGLREWLRGRYHKAFRGGKADEHGLRGMAVSLAGTKFGTTKEAYDADLHDVLTHVVQSIKEREEAESRAKQQR